MKQFEGKKVLITGGSRGIGLLQQRDLLKPMPKSLSRVPVSRYIRRQNALANVLSVLSGMLCKLK